jgi:hypothetical protein
VFSEFAADESTKVLVKSLIEVLAFLVLGAGGFSDIMAEETNFQLGTPYSL